MSNHNMEQLDKAHEKGVVLGLAGFGTGQRLDIDFRLPYWDYFRPRAYTKTTFPGVTNPKDGTTTAPYDWGAPQIFTMPKIMVKRLPDNELISMPNPFFQFEFSPQQLEKISVDNDPKTTIKEQFKKILMTIRHGGSNADAMAEMNKQLNKDRESRVSMCLALMEDEIYRNFRTFSTNAVFPKPNEKPKATLERPSGSIEDFHGAYHVTIGSKNGHMGSIASAAFDPIFWMHHCQIDRLFAIWQAANGDEHWFNELREKDQGLAKIDLTPFRKSVSENNEKKYWTSDLSRRTTDFGYTYPDLANGQTGDTVRKEFREKYEWARRTTARPILGTPPDSMQPVQVGEAQVFKYKRGTSSGDLFKSPGVPMHEMQQQTVMAAMSSNPQHADDWYIDVVVERMLADGTFTIYYIIGEVQGQTGPEWSTLPGFAGLSHILAAPANVCDNCATQEEQRQLVTSTTPITSLLLDYVKVGKLNSMVENDVKQFLIKNLKWRVETSPFFNEQIAGEVLNPRDMDRDHTFNLSISRKRTPVPRSAGDVQYDTYPEVIEAIIRNSS
ncbi:tyrosinase precursor (monophenol monooxygenase) [Fusarium tjaetaba]|uniref:tyrosinase n=1 Tax=Fusarium tjaetaba TaxID=1567544 RepID=A0A8H5S0K9_9HYPO|nr:tyrosinase precursor (monophenol monooxygenase) [Fusarium tjaetaba]KAF5642479.1 tyrosinase precursor (monophenol monooxygenase) [Fusarium tjaetaba]